jgi:glutathione S-transferase
MRTLYVGDHELSSWSLRPFMALAHSGLPFEVEVVKLNQEGTAARIAEVSPNGKVPCLHDDGVVIWESLAICEHVAELAPAARLWPDALPVRSVARSVSCEMHAGFVSLRREHPMRVSTRLPKPPSDEVKKDLARIDALFSDCRARFGADGPFLFGRFSIADCMFTPVATRIRTYDLPVSATTRAWCEAIFAHPAFVRWETAARLETAR